MNAITTTAERIQFVKNRIAERRAFADEQRLAALGNTVDGARTCLDLARLAEAQAQQAEITLLVLFPEGAS